MIPLFWLTNHEGIDAIGPWDTGILQRMIWGELWPHAIDFSSTMRNCRTIPDEYRGKPGVVVLPSRHHYQDIQWLNAEISKLSGVLLILSSDEDAGFPWRQIKHPNIRLWVQSPDDVHYSDCTWCFRFGYGWRYEFPDLARSAILRTGDREHAWSFSGQITNDARRNAASGLRRARAKMLGILMETDGFSKGLGVKEYVEQLANTWVAPAPAGPKTLDTFRLYEALELGCIPVVDVAMPDGTMKGFWNFMYPPLGPCAQSVVDWQQFGDTIEALWWKRERLSAQCSAWWQQTKRAMVKQLETDLRHIGCEVEPWAKTTVIVTASPVPSHPNMGMIMDVIGSAPYGCEVIVAMDGVRPEQTDMAAAYDEFCYRIAMWCEHDANATIPVVAPHWLHQTKLTEMALGFVDTPTVLFMEHDTPILQDRYIDWAGIVELVENDHIDVMRFHHEELILDVHEYMMIDKETKTMLGVPLRRTRQWSQRPAVYNTEYFRRILTECFTPGARCFIEDRMHSFAQHQSGHRLAIYHPDGHGIRRSGHLDGRAGGPKFEESQRF